MTFIMGNVDAEGFWIPVIQSGVYVRIPPPAVADIYLKELHKARIRQNISIHVVVIANFYASLG